jgi:small conductance mechanosensitive channel
LACRSPLLTAAGVIGLAVGFAAQETLANFIAGIVIFWDKPFRPGDWVEIEDTYGQVSASPSARRASSTSRADDHLPQQLCAEPQGQQPHDAPADVSIPIGVAYKESIDAARALLGPTHGDEPRRQGPARAGRRRSMRRQQREPAPAFLAA